MTTQEHRIEPGQEYAACAAWPDDIRIRVIEPPVPGAFGEGKVRIVSIADDGRQLRPRYVAIRKLHATGTVGAGELPRRTGYRLVRNADGSAPR